MEEIKPCPFCGGEGQIFCLSKSYNINEDKYRVECEELDCGAESPLFYTQEEAIKWWNRREN